MHNDVIKTLYKYNQFCPSINKSYNSKKCFYAKSNHLTPVWQQGPMQSRTNDADCQQITAL